MELPFDPKSIMIDCFKFAKIVKNSKQTCIVCMVDEDFDKHIWTRLQLRCGHQIHTRCFEKWCDHKGVVNCPYCGDVKDVPENHYCSNCDIFGHSHYGLACPKIREMG